jgi:hypothetical protein
MVQKYYAAEGKISQKPLNNGIEITPEQYQNALEAMSEGLKIAIRSETLRILSQDTIIIYKHDKSETREIPDNDDIPDGWTANAPGQFDQWVNGAWQVNQDLLTEAKTAKVAALRWAHETGGVEVDGVRFWTTRDSIPQWSRMLEKAKADPDFIVPAYKAMSGYVANLTATQILAADAAGEVHITKCFVAEMQVLDVIDDWDLDDIGEAFLTAYNGVEL